MRDKIVYVVVSLLLVATLFLGYTAYSFNKRIAATENGVMQIVQFLNQQIEASKPK